MSENLIKEIKERLYHGSKAVDFSEKEYLDKPIDDLLTNLESPVINVSELSCGDLYFNPKICKIQRVLSNGMCITVDSSNYHDTMRYDYENIPEKLKEPIQVEIVIRVLL